jgi:hypothetical protein
MKQEKTQADYSLRFYFKVPSNRWPSKDCLDGAVFVISSGFKGRRQKKTLAIESDLLNDDGFYLPANEFENNEEQANFVRYVLGEAKLRSIKHHYADYLTVEYIRDKEGVQAGTPGSDTSGNS